jgi:integrase
MARLKVVARRLTRVEKIKVRGDLGTLARLRIPANTRKRYGFVVQKFFVFLEIRGKSMPTDPDTLDTELCDYTEECWENGDPRGWCMDLLSGIAKFEPSLKHSYPLARTFVETWKLHELPERAAPMSLELVKAMVGYTTLVQKDPALATCLLLTFHCMLRIGECLSLQKGNIARSSGSALLNLGWTKGGKRRGERESVEATDETVLAFLDDVMQHLQPGDRLFPLSYQSFTRRFHELIMIFGLNGFNFKSHSLRRGGTTYEFRGHGSYDILCQRGRWSNARTARLYIAEAVEMTNALAFSAITCRLIEKHSFAFEGFCV